MIAKLTFPLLYPIVKGENDEKVRLKYAHKAAENVGLMTYYLVFTVWGFIVLKNSNIMPWFMFTAKLMRNSKY